MAKRTLDITTREQLEIYMNPQRQRLLHEMQVLARPATCKQLADVMGISASSVTHHMRKLETLGLVEVDHTEVIRGITARYWRFVPTDVSLHANDGGDLQEEKMLLVDYLNQRVLAGLHAYAASDAVEREKKLGLAHGELLSGVMYLTEDAALEFQRVVRAFVEKYDQPHEGAVPWEFSVACYPHRDFSA